MSAVQAEPEIIVSLGETSGADVHRTSAFKIFESPDRTAETLGQNRARRIE